MSAELQNRVSRGENARFLLQGLSETLTKLQREYLTELKMATAQGGDITTPAMKITVLDDVVEDIETTVESGRKAAEKLLKRKDDGREAAE